MLNDSRIAKSIGVYSGIERLDSHGGEHGMLGQLDGEVLGVSRSPSGRDTRLILAHSLSICQDRCFNAAVVAIIGLNYSTSQISSAMKYAENHLL